MIQHDAVQPAPAIVVLVGRATEGRLEIRAGQQVQCILYALQDQDIPPRHRIINTRHVEEVHPGHTETELRIVLVEQVAQGGHRQAARRLGHPNRSDDLVYPIERRIDRIADHLAAPDGVDRRGDTVPDFLSRGLGAVAVFVARIIAFAHACRRRVVPLFKPGDRLPDAWIRGNQAGQCRVGPGRGRGCIRLENQRRENLRVKQLDVGLDLFHVVTA